MPLVEVSPNIQESESAGRKRSHDEFSGDLMKVDEASEAKSSESMSIEASASDVPPLTPSNNVADFSPEGSPLTEPGSITPPRNSPTPQTPTKEALKAKPSTTQNPMSSTADGPVTMTLPVKRKRLTDVEREARDKEQAEKKKEREEKAAIQAVKKAKQEEEKAARAKERDEKRKKKEEEQNRQREEMERKLRAQKTLGSFFKIPSTPKKTDTEGATKDQSPTKGDSAAAPKRDSAYRAMFKSFYVKDNTRLAPPRMNEETQEAKSKVLDEYIASQQNEHLDFEPTELFAPDDLYRRGRLHQPVKHIMEKAYRETQDSRAAGGTDANKIYAEVRARLEKVPMKIIAFSQDVRPPYYGTLTYKTFALGRGNMYRLARRSMGRRLPLDYDYDSEAEWQDEEGEDVDVDDDEEELDDEDDMDGFLDDSEDVGISRRVFGNTMEPDSTGICFEDQNRLALNPKVYEHKMEFMLESLEEQYGIDPFSTKYWQPEPKPVKAKQTKAVKPETDSKMAPPPAPANAFAAIQGSASSAGGQAKLVKADLMNDFKQAILDNKVLSKVGIIDIIFHQFRDSVSRAEVKNTLEYVAEKKGSGRLKEWELKPGHEIVL